MPAIPFPPALLLFLPLAFGVFQQYPETQLHPALSNVNTFSIIYENWPRWCQSTSFDASHAKICGEPTSVNARFFPCFINRHVSWNSSSFFFLFSAKICSHLLYAQYTLVLSCRSLFHHRTSIPRRKEELAESWQTSASDLSRCTVPSVKLSPRLALFFSNWSWLTNLVTLQSLRLSARVGRNPSSYFFSPLCMCHWDWLWFHKRKLHYRELNTGFASLSFFCETCVSPSFGKTDVVSLPDDFCPHTSKPRDEHRTPWVSHSRNAIDGWPMSYLTIRSEEEED